MNNIAADGTGRPLRICLVAPNNYTILSARDDLHHIGGAEVQRHLIASELARRGYAVSFVTWDHGQPDGIVHAGIAVYKTCRPEAGLPVARFVYPRWTSLTAALARADADVYYQRTAGVESGQVALWCRHRGRRFVYAMANDAECDPKLLRRLGWRDRCFYLYALRRANTVIVQTELQRRRLSDGFGLSARIIPSCVPTPERPLRPRDPLERVAARRLLWVGRFAAQKRPELLLDTARLLNDFHFDVVGISPSGTTKSNAVVHALHALPNVTLHGFVPHRLVAAFYDRATALICTSAWEGFPNTYLEAWSHGIPTVTTIDPDGIIATHGLGAHTESPEALAEATRRLVASPDRWADHSARARRYFETHHTVEATGDAYEALLRELIPAARTRGPDRTRAGVPSRCL
jgi:glycosyltransferase involved in cell wall biosynthesis